MKKIALAIFPLFFLAVFSTSQANAANDPFAQILNGWMDHHIVDFVITDLQGNVVHGYRTSVHLSHVYVIEQGEQVAKFKITGSLWDAASRTDIECGKKVTATNTLIEKQENIEVSNLAKNKFILYIQLANSLDNSTAWIKRQISTIGCSGISLITTVYMRTVTWPEIMSTPQIFPPTNAQYHSCSYDMNLGAEKIVQIIKERIQQQKELRHIYSW